MIAIHDVDGDGRLRLPELLEALLRHSHLEREDRLALTRMGGVGRSVWRLESALDAGRETNTSIDELSQIASAPGQTIDELHCGNDQIRFGILDATYLFVKAADKSIEDRIAAQFERVTSVPATD